MPRSKILTRFLLRRFFIGVGLVLLIVCGIILAVTFVERLPSNPTIIAAVFDAWRRLLEYVPLFLPLAVFMGTLLASYNLTKSTENVILSGAGMSPYQCARPFLIGAALIGIFAATVINPYSVKLNENHITATNLNLIDNSIWLREVSENGYLTMTAKGIQNFGSNLVFNNATLFVQDKDFKLKERVKGKIVVLSDEGISAKSATVWDTDGVPVIKNWHTKTLLTPRTVLERYLQPDQISFWQLPGFIKKMKAIGVPVRAHLVQFWTLLFLPLTMVAMAALGVAFSQTRQRRKYTFGVKFSLGILTCFILYFLVSMFNAMGATGALPPLLAIIAPPIIIIAGVGAFITSFDTI